MPSLIFATIMLPFALMLSVFTGMLMAATILFALQLPYVIVGAAWLVTGYVLRWIALIHDVIVWVCRLLFGSKK